MVVGKTHFLFSEIYEQVALDNGGSWECHGDEDNGRNSDNDDREGRQDRQDDNVLAKATKSLAKGRVFALTGVHNRHYSPVIQAQQSVIHKQDGESAAIQAHVPCT